MLEIRRTELFYRPASAPVLPFQVGRSTALFPEWLPGVCELELDLFDRATGRKVTGIAGDWPAFAWLDKRIEIDGRQRFQSLLDRLLRIVDDFAGQAFPDVQALWIAIYPELASDTESRSVADRHPVALCETFCRSLLERAIWDAITRLHQLSFQAFLKTYSPELSPERANSAGWRQIVQGWHWVAERGPVSSRIAIRHTIGQRDPLKRDQGAGSVAEAIEEHGITFFKIKVSGDIKWDLERLQAIANVIPDSQSWVTIDGNEAFESAEQLWHFVSRLAREQPEFMERVRFLEQPLSRHETLAPDSRSFIAKVAKHVPLAIDEADATWEAFASAIAIGYTGVSHKNCKGILKTFKNQALIQQSNDSDRLFLTGEDLTNLPLVPLHQDLVVAASLGLTHIERNGHHYFPDLSYLPVATRQQMLADYPQLYVGNDQDGVTGLRIVDGYLNLEDLQCPGLGIRHLPGDQGRISARSDWDSR